MKFTRRTSLKFAAACAAACVLPLAAHAQTFPTKPIRLVVPYGPGGATDILGRLIAQKMQELLGQTVIVDNKAGASGSIGTDFVAKSQPDGHTLIMATIGSQAINPVLYQNLPYDVNRDFAPVGLALTNHFVLAVATSVPARTIADLAAYSKTSKLFIGTAGYQQQLFGAVVSAHTGLEMTNVPYKGTAAALIDLASGNVQVGFVDIAGAVPFIQSNKIVPLAVSGTRRSSALPNVPTIAEAAKIHELDASGWMGILAPAGTPPAVIAALNAALNKSLALPEMREKFAQVGAEPATSTPEEFGTLIRSEVAKWTRVAKAAGIKGE
ncbi:MAG: tripartite tricarboxylate transporter substrate binding protein [Rubrivivax sp.]|nr:tripartite tricarboxylate transporter substrate binding protein [Rubrivivax sp.]